MEKNTSCLPVFGLVYGRGSLVGCQHVEGRPPLRAPALATCLARILVGALSDRADVPASFEGRRTSLDGLASLKSWLFQDFNHGLAEIEGCECPVLMAIDDALVALVCVHSLICATDAGPWLWEGEPLLVAATADSGHLPQCGYDG